MPKGYKTIADVEIFTPGTFRNRRWTEEDLQEMVKNFDALQGEVDVPIKVTHADDNRGLPLAGWVTDLKISGKKLVADIMTSSKEFYEWIKNGGYRKRSAEIYLNYKDQAGKVRGKVLRAVAFVPVPEVKSLADIEKLDDRGNSYALFEESWEEFAELPITVGAWDASAAETRIRKWAGGPAKETMDWGKYAQAFFWHDTSDPENFGSYKLPFADVVDGDLKAVTSGIFAAAAAVQGARGGVQLPAGDLAKVKSHISRYYKTLNRETPWMAAEQGSMSPEATADIKQAMEMMKLHIDEMSPDLREHAKAMMDMMGNMEVMEEVCDIFWDAQECPVLKFAGEKNIAPTEIENLAELVQPCQKFVSMLCPFAGGKLKIIAKDSKEGHVEDQKGDTKVVNYEEFVQLKGSFEKQAEAITGYQKTAEEQKKIADDAVAKLSEAGKRLEALEEENRLIKLAEQVDDLMEISATRKVAPAFRQKILDVVTKPTTEGVIKLIEEITHGENVFVELGEIGTSHSDNGQSHEDKVLTRAGELSKTGMSFRQAIKQARKEVT